MSDEDEDEDEDEAEAATLDGTRGPGVRSAMKGNVHGWMGSRLGRWTMDYISMLSLSGLSLACSQRPEILFLSCILHFFSILSLEQGFQSALGAITGGGPARGQKAVGGGYRIGQDLKLYRIQIQIQNTEYRTLNTDTEYNGKCYDKSRVRVGLCILHRPSSSCAPMPVRSAWPHGDALNSTQLNSTPAPPDFKITRTAGIETVQTKQAFLHLIAHLTGSTGTLSFESYPASYPVESILLLPLTEQFTHLSSLVTYH